MAFRAPYKLERGGVFDVECRNGKTGDGAFLAVTKLAQGKSLEELPSSFFLDCLFDTTGRFSFYGPPMDVKVKKSQLIDNDRRVIELTFSNLSQSTNAEIPHNAVLVATIPKGTKNATMLVASSNSSLRRKGGAGGKGERYRRLLSSRAGAKDRHESEGEGSIGRPELGLVVREQGFLYSSTSQ